MTAPAAPEAGLAVDVRVGDRLDAALTAAPGQVVAVVGPNGAGKTTLLRAVAGLVPVDGELRLGGASWVHPPRLVQQRRVGFVLQDRSLFPHLTALANVAFGLRTRGLSRREAETHALAWLERLGVGELAARRPRALSGGQAQRVAIARALASDPEVLLLDEPFAGLDVGVATALRVELARHLAAYRGVTLLVTHDALDALTLADHVVVLDAGRVAQQGPPGEVSARPRTEHVARLVGLNVLREPGAVGFTAFSPRDVTVSRAEPAGSARLRWSGRLVHLAPHGDAVRLLTACHGPGGAAEGGRGGGESEDPGGQTLLADVTPAATAELGLEPGVEVWLSVKATAVRRY